MKKPEKADSNRDAEDESADESVFNETLKRMLKTPPAHHAKQDASKPARRNVKTPGRRKV
jgi:hypothetical protein